MSGPWLQTGQQAARPRRGHPSQTHSDAGPRMMFSEAPPQTVEHVVEKSWRTWAV
jgi:hypothetical protein